MADNELEERPDSSLSGPPRSESKLEHQSSVLDARLMAGYDERQKDKFIRTYVLESLFFFVFLAAVISSTVLAKGMAV